MEKRGGLGSGVWAAGSTEMERLKTYSEVRVRGRKRVGLGRECVLWHKGYCVYKM